MPPPVKQLQCLMCHIVSMCIIFIPLAIYSLFKVGQILYIKTQ